MWFSGPGNDNFVGSKLLFLTRNMKRPLAPENVIDLIGFGMGVNALLLPRLQAIDVTEVFCRIEEGDLLHLVIGKTDELTNITSFHLFGVGPTIRIAAVQSL